MSGYARRSPSNSAQDTGFAFRPSFTELEEELKARKGQVALPLSTEVNSMSDDSTRPIVIKAQKVVAGGAHGGAWKIARRLRHGHDGFSSC